MHHKNPDNNYIVNYESFGVNVIIPEGKEEENNLGKMVKYSFNIFALMGLLLL